MADITPARKLFDLLVSRDFDPEMLDSSGLPADPEDAEIFSIDFRAESGKDYGTVVIMLNDEGELQVYCTDNVGRSMEGTDKTNWFQFLEQLKNFATRNFFSFGIKNLNRLRYSMQGQAAIKEGLFESWAGNRTTSWMGEATQARLMIRHHKNIAEGDARHRYIESLFIETTEGERYKLPFKKLSGGRAMLEHVKAGGKPYDARGQHIVTMVEEVNVLTRFRRANAGQLFEGDAATLVEQTNAYYENLQGRLKNLSTTRGYTAYFESWSPSDITDEEVVIESLKNLFVKQTIDTRIESALPLLARIQQQGTDMKEANIFEAWVESLSEGTWQTPDTPEKQTQLVELMSQDLPVGADATNATEQLYDLLGDDELFDQLEALAEQDPNADARQVIYDRLQMLSDNPDVRAVIEQLQIDPEAEMNPAEPTDAEYADTSVGAEPSGGVQGKVGRLAESVLTDDTGSTFQHILDTFKRDVKDFEVSDELSDELYNALYDYYHEDMPYGVKKARSGDPHEWVADRFAADLGIPGAGLNSPGIGPEDDPHLERESVMHGDYAEEAGDPLSSILKSAGVPAQERLAPDYMTGDMEENKEGSTGQIVKKLLDPIAQGLAGGSGGKSLSIPLVGEEETDEGILGTVGGAMGGGMLGTLAGGALGAAMGGPAGAALGATAGGEIGRAAGAVGGQEMTKGGSGIIEDDREDKDNGSVIPALAAGALGAGLGYAAGSYVPDGSVDVDMVSPNIGGGNSAPLKGADSILEKDELDTIRKHAGLGEEETDEGWKGQVAGGMAGSSIGGALGAAGGPIGSIAGQIAGGIAGSELGDKIGDKMDNKLFGKEETDESSPLQGQYGHSGKMKPVSKDLSFLDRLKELSGLKRG
jgi:hypothetical protein